MYKRYKDPSKTVLCSVYCNWFFLPITNSLTLSPQSFTSHHLRPYKTFPQRLVPPPQSLYCTTLHLIPLHYASFISLYLMSLRCTLYRIIFHLSNVTLRKNYCLIIHSKDSNTNGLISVADINSEAVHIPAVLKFNAILCTFFTVVYYCTL